MIPSQLGLPLREISYVDVQLASEDLRDVALVDTPGLSPGRSPDSSRGTASDERPVQDDSLDVAAEADAILYVFTDSVDDAAARAVIRSVSTRLPGHQLTSLGLFNKVDTLVPAAADPWPVAGPRAAEQAAVLRRVVSDVVPVVALLAETTESGQLTTVDIEALRSLAQLPQIERVALLESADSFTVADGGAAQPVRQRLLRLLDLYGVAFAVAQFAAVPDLPDDELIRLLFTASGFHRLRHTLDHALRWRADEIKANWALAALQNIAARAPYTREGELLRNAIELASRTGST